jgi:hypothetical protein
MKLINSSSSVPPEIAAEMHSEPIISGLTAKCLAELPEAFACLSNASRHLGMFRKLQLHKQYCYTAQFLSLCTTCACLPTGTLYRESGVVSGITNRRWAALFPHCVATFRKEGSQEPSKVWPLSPRCQLSKIKSKEFMVREKHTSTIWALAAGHYDRKSMVRLPIYHAHS